MNAPKVLFICDDGSCSLMAASFLRKLANGTFDVESAGVRPVNEPPSGMVDVLRELGIWIPGQTPETIYEHSYDVVVVLGGGSPGLSVPGDIKCRSHYHWTIPELPSADMPSEEQLARARNIRDKIREAVERLYQETLTPKGLFAW